MVLFQPVTNVPSQKYPDYTQGKLEKLYFFLKALFGLCFCFLVKQFPTVPIRVSYFAQWIETIVQSYPFVDVDMLSQYNHWSEEGNQLTPQGRFCLQNSLIIVLGKFTVKERFLIVPSLSLNIFFF